MLAAGLLAQAPSSRPAGPAPIELIGAASFSGDARDRSGLTDLLDGGVPHDRLGALGSGIAWSGAGSTYFMLPDRGPGDGAAAYKTRFHEVEIVVDPAATPSVRAEVRRTVVFRDEQGVELVGSAAADPAIRFDPEALRRGSGGTLFVADEYGPSISEFGQDGARRRLLPVPARYAIRAPDENPAKELKRNARGRVPNRGFEGLAIAPDGLTLFALPQGPLIQDHGRQGINCRVLAIDLVTRRTREHVVSLDAPSHGFNEILAIDGQTFLALELDPAAGSAAKKKRVVRIDLASASDVSSIEALPKGDLPPWIRPARKSPLLDLLDPAFGLAGESFPLKVEGLAFGPDLSDRRRLLLVTSDNDMIATAPTWIWAFAVPKERLEARD
jgi:hypothetical protein